MKVPEPRRLKSGTWYIQMRLNGRSVTVKDRSKTECRHKAEAIKSQHRLNKRHTERNDSAITLSGAIDEYIKAKQNELSPASIRAYRIVQRNRFQDYMDRPIKSIKNWQRVYDDELKLDKPPSAKTLKNAWSLVRSAYKHHYKEPMPEISILPVAQSERPYLDAEQIPIFIKAIRGRPCETAALLALHSLRCSELLALTWDKVDLKNRRLLVSGAVVPNESNELVHKDTNKTASSRRYVPIFIDALYEALQNAPDKHGYVVTSRSQPSLMRSINTVCKRNGLPQVGLHGLRHSFASLCVHLGIPEETAMSIGGWSDFTTMRKIYTHISQRDHQAHTDLLKQFYNNNAN